MITDKEALALEQAQFPESSVKQALVVLDVLDKHIRKTMTFGGATPIEIPCSDLSQAACLVVCYIMRQFGWDAKCTLLNLPSRIGGNPQPHHWLIQIAPLNYNDHPVVQQIADQHEASHTLLS